ncbi:hypothetical protein PQX77_011303 [Marasmius sp. AFHP31]|nr:hypothetical protein PQX77_011303 [Marasmius sp. AFHP31]
MRFTDLPDDIVLELVSYLNVFAAYSLSVTCRRLWSLSRDDTGYYWLTVLTNHQKFNSSRLLPLPPHKSIVGFECAHLRSIVIRMIQLERNLSAERPALREPPIQLKIRDMALPFSFDMISGTPLLIVFSNLNRKITCFDYEQLSALCELTNAQMMMMVPISPPYHEYGRCTQVLRTQPLFNVTGSRLSLSLLQLDYHFNSEQGRWKATIRAHPLQLPAVEGRPGTVDTPFSDSPLSSTNGEVVAYCAANFGDGASETQLRIVILNVKTGMSTRVSTGITLYADKRTPNFILVLKDRDLYVTQDKIGCTHIWRIPGTLLPYGDQAVEPDVVFPLTPDNDIGHRYDILHDALAIDDSILQYELVECDSFRTILYLSHSLHPSVQATFHRYRLQIGDETHLISQYRRWYLPDPEHHHHRTETNLAPSLALSLPELKIEDVWEPDADWPEPPMIFSSLSSCLYILPGDPVAKLMLIRYYDSPAPAMSRHRLELPRELEEVLLQVGHLVFDESLGVALLILDDGTLWVLKFGPTVLTGLDTYASVD